MIDCHLHFSGAISVACAASLAGCSCAAAEARLVPTEDAPKTLLDLISRFSLLDQIAWSQAALGEAIASVRATIGNLSGCWMRVSVDKYVRAGMNASDVLSQISAGLPNARIVLAFRYEEQTWHTGLINHPAVAGIDFVGDEHQCRTKDVCHVVSMATEAGRTAFVHVGETLSQADTLWRIQMMAMAGARNICHGVRAFALNTAAADHVPHNEVIAALADIGCWLHMSPSSNYWTGAWPDINNHPAGWLADAGVKVTVGADDPVQCKSTTAGELQLFKPDTAARLAANAMTHWMAFKA